ncbi:glycosyltransferase [Coprobacter tertius]|uniref:Glycogen/starch synthase n=1 Tax=Coprobacter tertius TaxID=2944915 RepID=A0ABT1MHD5_9BACT|nr:glycogen/starch synthase [Coprobacter tertius]MCP9611791.1 glycogen/starch synthase [Coprobacter tertius]
MENKQQIPDYIFETSWEVCNLVGGIYTVLSTKAKTLQKLNKDRNIFIGPDIWKDTESPFFTESGTLLKEWRSRATAENLKVRVGRWNIPGKPIVVLVDFNEMYAVRNELFTKMWNWYDVDSLYAYGDYDESCIFSYAAALVIESLYKYLGGEKLNIVAHFDEWTTGMGLLYVKHRLPQIATLFTTHATSIGRSIAGNNKPLYDYLAGYNGDQMARELNMVAKHSLEKQAARHADCFTTVSDITARECAQLLSKNPDIVTPNGFEDNFVPKGVAYQDGRREARERLLKIASVLIGYKPSDDAFLIATSGRYEYKNKGIDLFIDSLRRLKDSGDSTKELIAFILVPAWVKEPRQDVAERLNSKKNYNTSLPNPLITHVLNNYYEDRVMNQLHAAGFKNNPGDKVKVIFIPSYLTGDDGVVNKPYYETLIGFDATAFPSYYEPWGYTPLESIAFGIPTITTDLSGFGQWACSAGKKGIENTGVVVLRRTDSNFGEVADNLASTVKSLSEVSEKEKQKIAKSALAMARKAHWAHFIKYYLEAYDMALNKI